MVTLVQGSFGTGAFILSLAGGQRSLENGVVADGQNELVAGTVLAGTQDALVAYTDGATAIGILLHDVDATDDAVACAYVARDAEVNLKLLTYPEESSSGAEEADTIASLKLLGIICRD